MKPANRPYEGQALADILYELATISAAADTLRLSLEPLTAEDIADGMEPLTTPDIQHELEHMSSIVTRIALQYVRAEAAAWNAATDGAE